jgi:CBS domain containing-hemolysin-like protein
MAINLVIALALVAANGFFVACEFALARVRATQIDDFQRAGRAGARSVRHAVAHLDAYLAACQLGITVASIGLGIAGKPAFEQLLAPVLGDDAAIGGIAIGALLAFGLMTVLHVVVGELAPKSIAISRTDRVILALAPPLRVFYLATKPVVDLFNGMGNLLLRPFRIPPAGEAHPQPHSESELRELLVQSAQDGLIDDREQQIAERGFVFNDRRAVDVMQPRSAIHYLTSDQTIDSAAAYAVAAGHTRLPVCDPIFRLRKPLGIIHVQDLLGAVLRGEPDRLDRLLRPIDTAGATTPIADLLDHLRQTRQQIALIAVDDAVIGLVTLEDLFEELVGEIEEEHPLPRQAAASTRARTRPNRPSHRRESTRAAQPPAATGARSSSTSGK